MQILVIDDDVALCRSLKLQLEGEGHGVDYVHRGAEGLEQLQSLKPDLLFLDLNLPDAYGLDILRTLQERKSESVVIMITGVQDAKATIAAIRSGAFDYIRKPLDLDAILLSLEKASRHIKSRLSKPSSEIPFSETSPHEIVGADPKVIEILKQIALLSENNVSILVTGESGTGKELVARTLHDASAPEHPFVAVNCSAIVATLLESELFGHEKGAYTGADTARVGKIELAGEGILFLDEIGDMSPDLQAKLLRVLQEREFERVGGAKLIPFMGRIVAATNRDLPAMVAEGAFREDLYYRLAVSTIQVPALRERRSDIPSLAEHILSKLNRELHKELREIEEGAVRRLQAYDWPGNVRELVNVLTRAALLARGTLITKEVLLASLGQGQPQPKAADAIQTLRDAEKEHVEKSLLAKGWNIMRTAEQLGVSRVTLRKKIEDYQLKKPAHLG
jgi:two-component system, NtrC family, response regulator AtoC